MYLLNKTKYCNKIFCIYGLNPLL